MLYFVLISISLILFLVGFLIYTDYKDNITFRGEKFSESIGAHKLINFFMPSPRKVRKIDTRLFYLTNDTTVRDFIMLKIIVFVCSIILSFSIVYTNYLHSRTDVFLKNRNIPFTISEDDYYALTTGINFDVMDKMKDKNIMQSNAQHLSNYQKYLTIDSTILYDSLLEIRTDLNSLGGLKSIALFILIVVFIFKLPDMILYQLNKILVNDMDFEFAKLESYIYLNASKKVDTIIRGLTYESIIFRRYFTLFLSRYREDSEMSFDLVLSSSGIHPKFKQLVEYLLLLQHTEPQRVRDKISVNQENHLSIVTSSIINSVRSKKTICNVLIYASLFLAVAGLIEGVMGSINFGELL